MAGRGSAPKLEGVRRARIKIPPEEAEAAYHCFDRVVGCAFLLKDAEMEMLCRMILVVADFCGVLVHAYLNCVRARLARDPKDYRFSSYGQAVAGSEVARQGIAGVLGEGSWEETQREYRVLLFTTGSEEREKGGFISEEDLQKVLKEGGQLPLATVLRCRVRYFSRGAVLGSTAFVEKQLERLKQRLPCPRTRCRPLPGVTDWGELAVLCRVRGSGLAPPAHEGA